jgi:hypothetical protein
MMALSLEGILVVKQKSRFDSRKAGVTESLRALWAYMDYLSNPDLQLVAFSGLETADVVIADAACKVHAIYMKKPAASTTNAWFKGSNHASAAAANGDFATFLVGTGGGGREYCPIYADGLPMGTGFTVGCHTTVNGNTKSNAADAATGFVIIGAPLV